MDVTCHNSRQELTVNKISLISLKLKALALFCCYELHLSQQQARLKVISRICLKPKA